MKKFIIWMCCVLGGILTLSICWLFWYTIQKPTLNEDFLLQINDLVRPADADQAKNAWVDYEKAIYIKYADPNVNIQQVIENTHGQTARFILFTDLPFAEQEKVRGWIAQNVNETPFNEDVTAQIMRALKDRQLSSQFIGDIFETVEPFLSDSGEPLRVNGPSVVWVSFDQVWEALNKHINNDSFASWSNLRLVAELLQRWIETSELQDQQIDLWIAQNEAAWQSYIEGSRKPQLYFDYASELEEEILFNYITPGFDVMEPLRQLGCWKIRKAVNKGDLEGALQICLAMIRTGHQMQQGEYLNSDLWRGIQFVQWACVEMLNILDTQPAASDILVSIQGELETLLQQNPAGVKFDGERILFRDLVQHSYTDGGIGGGHILYEEYNIWAGWDTSDVDLWESLERWFEGSIRPDWAMTIPGSMRHAKRDETLKRADQFYDRLNDLGQMSPWERYSANITITDDFRSLDKTKYSLILTMEPHFFLYERSIGLSFQSQALTNAVSTILALKRWQQEEGQYPEDLPELLAKGYLRELPDDPFGPGSLTYQRRDDDFILYSWEDYMDNGGQRLSLGSWEDRRGDRVFWPIRKK